ncbi:predicted protein [Streptomyces sp. SPB78]|nr:predicted protein [Streptomyces sp. SPB78]
MARTARRGESAPGDVSGAGRAGPAVAGDPSRTAQDARPGDTPALAPSALADARRGRADTWARPPLPPYMNPSLPGEGRRPAGWGRAGVPGDPRSPSGGEPCGGVHVVATRAAEPPW